MEVGKFWSEKEFKFSELWDNVGRVETEGKWLCGIEACNQGHLDDGHENQIREEDQGTQFHQEAERNSLDMAMRN